MVRTIPLYILATVIVITLYFLYQIKQFKKHPLVFAYIFAIVSFAVITYLSIIQFRDRPAATALVFFTIIPLLIVDKPLRFNSFTVILFSIHATLSFIYKGSLLGGVDLLNTFVSLVLGILFGILFLFSRLNNFEMNRLLRVEKETDFLTGLYNRRKLFKDLNITNQSPTTIGILMIDIDKFKQYNDTHGHQAGDVCLIKLADAFKKFSETYNLEFYRYGGEEFIGVLYNTNKKQLHQLADEIRKKASALELLGDDISISIGLSFNDNYHSIEQSEQLLILADKALYKVKEEGGNGVYGNFVDNS